MMKYAIIIACMCVWLSFTTKVHAASSYEQTVHNDGSLQYKVKLNRKSQRVGKYTEYFPSGKPTKKGRKKEMAKYKNGQLHGKRQVFNEEGQLERDEVYIRGELIYPMTREFLSMRRAQIRQQAMDEMKLQAKLFRMDDKALLQQVDIVTRINEYRLICGLEPDVKMKHEYAQAAQKVAELSELIGGLHLFKANEGNPGMVDKEYKLALQNITHCRWTFGELNVSAPIDWWMGGIYGSGNNNRRDQTEFLRGRLTVLSNHFTHTGYGKKGLSTALWIQAGKSSKENRPIVAFPNKGFVPLSMFNGRSAWQVFLEKKWYKVGRDAQMNVYKINTKTLEKTGGAALVRMRNDALDLAAAESLTGYRALVAQFEGYAPVAGESCIVVITGVEKLRKDAPNLSYRITFYKD